MNRQVFVEVPGVMGMEVNGTAEEKSVTEQLEGLGYEVITHVTHRKPSKPEHVWVLHVMYTSGLTKMRFKTLDRCHQAEAIYNRMGYETNITGGVIYG